MLAQEIAPTEIGKHAKIIRAAQEELANMDVLVCGRCLRAFNFVEEFRSHKEDDACEKENANLKESLDTKPTIWAFTLWKATQLHTRKVNHSSSSWALYQHWVKLEDSVREPWIVAGRTIQSFGKIGHGQLQDMPVRITKTVVNPNNNNNNNSTANSNTSSVSPTRKSPAGKLPTVASQLKDTENERPKSKPGTPTPTGASSPGATVGNVKNHNRIAIRVDPKTDQRTEEAVESIVAKRFNPRRKTHEYLVKWIDWSHNENTWEVMANLERVPYFLQMFEKQLARQKLKREKSLDALKRMQQEKQQDKQTTAVTSKSGSAPLSPQSSAAVSPNSSLAASRPSRTSKTKAMDQFKQWGNESGGGEGSTSPSSANEDESATEQDWSTASTTPMAIKRKLNHTDSSADGSAHNASNESIELEDLEEDLPSHTVKRLKNGGSSVQLNKPKIQTSSMPTTPASRVNGNTSTTAFSEETKMGEIIYTDDSTSSGMFRKPEMPNSIQIKRQRTEGPVRYLTRTEMSSSNRGIFRIDKSESSAALPAAKSSPSASSATVAPAKRMAVGRSSGNNSPVTVGQRPHVMRTVGQGAASLQRRPVGSSSTPNSLRQVVAPARGGAPAGTGRMLVTRANTPQQRTGAVGGGKAVTPEQKILQLSKSGDLKVTRKVMTREDLLAQRAAQVRQQRQQHAQALQRQEQQQQQVQIQKVQQLNPLRQRAANAAAAKAQPMQMEMEVEQEEVAQHQAQLCPITGKLIGQEETQLQMEQEQQQEQQREQLEAAAQELLGSDQQVLTNEDGSALLVRGEDGTVYQVAGKNAEGQTILVTQGPDGEQQFAYVAAAEGEDQDVLTLDNAVAEAVAAVGQQGDATADGEQILVSMTEEELAQHQAALLQQQQQQEATPAGSTPPTAQIHITTSDSDGTEAQIPAEVVQADLPSPGGTRRVVLLLQDGTFMMTEMPEDQFKSLNIPT